MSWQEKWEEYASLERKKYIEMKEEDLLAEASGGRWGSYYTIWYVIAERVSSSRAVPVLFSVLNRETDYLYRYHAAAALLKLARIDRYTAVDLSGGHPGVKDNLRSVEAMLREMKLLPL